MINKKKSVALFCISLTLIFSTVSINASINDLKNQQSGIENDIDEQKKLLEEANNQMEVTQNEIIALDKELEASRNKLLEITAEVEATNKLLDETNAELTKIQDEYDKKYEIFKERLKVMYEFGNVGYIEVLIGSESVSDFFNRLEYVNTIANHDKEIMDTLVAMEKDMKVKLAEIESYKMEVDKLLAEQTNVTRELNTKKANKESMMASLETNAEEFKRNMAELEQDSKDIEAMIKDIQAKAAANNNNKVYYTGGILGWPVPTTNRLSSYYGSRIHPVTGVETFHHGVDIPASTGEVVVAVESGVVIVATYQNGYGNVVIIDHGDGVTTLYGHNSSLSVSAGQEVTKGQQIALIGSTGLSTGPHCHFEVRINGATTNPLPYLGM